MIGCLYFIRYTRRNILDHRLCVKHFFVLQEGKGENNELNDRHQNCDHILFLFFAIEAVEADEPGPAPSKKNKTDNENALSESRLHQILFEIFSVSFCFLALACILKGD